MARFPGADVSRSVERDALRRTEAPFARDHPEAALGWWEWQDDSTPFFWNCPQDYQEEVRDGQPHLLVGEFSKFRRPQAPARDPEQHEKMRAKMVKSRKHNYIQPGLVDSLLHYFCVAKGLNDIRTVYDGTGCGLNDSVWAPNFELPTVRL